MELDFHKDPSVVAGVLDAMADGLFTVDAEGRFVAWSQGAERITGYSSAEVEGKPCTLLEGANCKGFGSLADMLADPEAARSAGIHHQECKVLGKDGREIYIHGNVRVMTDAAGAVVGAVGTFTDLTSFVLANKKIALLEEQAAARASFDQLIGAGAAMQEVFRRLRLAAQSDVSVFLSGESGTGKELAARALHAASGRAAKPFVAVNCSAIPEALLESELFGHVQGAFTGAARDRAGLFQAAEGGTLFLDEIGDVSTLLQLKLLRVLQEREVRRVGDEKSLPVDVRLVTATHQDLIAKVAEGTFREDFYYRIHVFEIHLPPLRERREDIPLLVEHFIREFARLHDRPHVASVTKDALDRLRAYPWPGNVRELRNAIEHAFVTVGGDAITLLDLPESVRDRVAKAAAAAETSHWTAEEVDERRRFADAIAAADGNKTAAARNLGVSRVTMWKKVKKYGLGD